MARVRITIGRALLALALITTIHSFCCTDEARAASLFETPNATAAPRLLDVYNDADISTTVKIVNTTDDPQPLPRPCEFTTCTHPQLAPHSVLEFATAGRGVLSVTYDGALTVYSEISSRFGRLRQEPCVPVDSLWIHDLIPAGIAGFNSGVFVAPADRDTVVSLDGGPQVAIPFGEAVVLSNSASVAHLIVQSGAGKVCAFAYGNQQDDGALFAITH